jgi:hypothetical protein
MMTSNDMRDKLVELLLNCERVDLPLPIEYQEHLADHLIANGVIVPPCKVGDKVYTIFEGKIEVLEIICSSRTVKNSEDVYEHYDARNDFLIMPFSDCHIGKTVFLTKAQAEQKLKELSENGWLHQS